MDYQVELDSDETVYDGFFQMHRYRLRHALFGGGLGATLTRECMHREPVVVAVPYDPRRDQVVLLEQFRVGALGRRRPWLVEVVAGIVEPGERPEEVVRRETQEEAGCRAGRVEPITGCYTSPGGSSEWADIFCVEVDSDGVGGIHGLDREGEDIRVFTVPREAAVAMAADGRVDTAAPIIALQWLAMHYPRLQQAWQD